MPSRVSHWRSASISSAGRFLLGDQMIEAEHHQRVGIVENARVDRKLLPGLVHALVHGDWLSRLLADELLETKQRQMEQFERAGDALQEHLGYSGFHTWARPRDALR